MDGTAYFMDFNTSDGARIGYISVASSNPGTVVYQAFTGGHNMKVTPGVDHNEWEIVKIVSIDDRTLGEPLYVCEPTTTAQDKAVIGIGTTDVLEAPNPKKPYESSDDHQYSIISLGNWKLKVCSEGGNIETGDFLCSSNTRGHGMKQSEEQLMNYTVAKASESVDWSTEPSDTKIIHVTLHLSLIHI